MDGEEAAAAAAARVEAVAAARVGLWVVAERKEVRELQERQLWAGLAARLKLRGAHGLPSGPMMTPSARLVYFFFGGV